MVKGRKKLLILVGVLSLMLHAGAIYLLCRLSLSGELGELAKTSFSFPLSGLIDKEIAEVTMDETKEIAVDAIEEKIDGQEIEALFNLSPSEDFLSSSKEPALAFTSLGASLDDGTLLASFEEDTHFFEKATQLEFTPTLTDFEYGQKTEKELSTGEHFTYQIEYAPRRFKAGYVFKIALQPRTDVPFKRMRQNFFFLIDRSNSIPRGRYVLNKKVVHEALNNLSKEDRFNILVFDDKVVRLSDIPIFANEENIAKAQDFLDNLSHGGFFSTTDIYASLGRVLPRLVSDTEINSAILLSDGDTYLSLENQRLLIRNWSEANAGKITLYCLASGTGNNLSLLEMISAFNKGAFIYVADHSQLQERLSNLLLSLRHPLGKEITLSTVALSKEATPHLLPKSGRLPDLYKHRPYIIYGTTTRLEDFTLFLQGRFYDSKFDLSKKISFEEARFGTLELERKYTALLAQDYFEQFFKDGKVAHLESAKQLLAPLNMAVPFLH